MWPLKLLEAAGLQAVPTGRFAAQPLALLSSVPEEDQATTASKALPCRGGNLHSAAPRPKTAVPLSRSLPCPASSKSTAPMCTRRHCFRGCARELGAGAQQSPRGLRAVGEEPALHRFTPPVVKARVPGTFPGAGSWRLSFTSATVFTCFVSFCCCFFSEVWNLGHLRGISAKGK